MEAKDLLPIDLEFDEPCDAQLDAVADLEEAAQHLDLERWIVNQLRHCERELTINIPLVRDDGSAGTFTAYRMQHACWKGPTLGGISLTPNAHVSALRAAAMNSTWQSALLDLPVGGAAGAIVCDPESLQERDLRQLAREYVYGLRGMLGRYSDVTLPGQGCNEQIVCWMLDEYAQTLGRIERGTVTGAPVELSGLSATIAPVARGVLAIVRNLFATRVVHRSRPAVEDSFLDRRVSVQGFGETGSSIARMLHDNGARVVGVADKSGAVYNVNGLDVPALQEHVRTNRVVFGFPTAEPCSNVDVLESDCDVLITAAGERQVTTAVADRVQASIVVEASRSAITRAAERVLRGRNVVVVPEVLATAGALVAAYLEWKQAEQIAAISAEDVVRDLEQRIVKACDAVFDRADARGLTPRGAANLIALDRVATELRLRR
jgi:glutamate dehydrogenase (NAD(P)+)